MSDARKVLIYATWRDRLLVFDEPDFPDVPLQVPGGTVEPDEEIEAAARRELLEETGLAPQSPFRHLVTANHAFEKNHRLTTHRRSYFTVEIEHSPAEIWEHLENNAHDGSPPIRFRLFWLSFTEARERLGLGMGEALTFLIDSQGPQAY